MGNCIKICRNGRFLVKLGNGQGALRMKIYVPFWYYVERNSWNAYWKEDSSEQKLWINSVALVRTRTIPTERPTPVGEVSANFCG